MRDGLLEVGCVIFLRLAGRWPRVTRWLGWAGPTTEPEIVA